ncbi:MAG: preprotein translocase subunit SecG [Clostridiales bacterium]|nr:preprotein translocase subunit SecG [Clostridiales bacterium]
MSIIQIISGIVLLIASVVIILVVLIQESKEQGGLSSAIGGSSNDSFYGKNSGRSRDAQLTKFTKICAITFYVVTLAVNIISQIL